MPTLKTRPLFGLLAALLITAGFGDAADAQRRRRRRRPPAPPAEVEAPPEPEASREPDAAPAPSAEGEPEPEPVEAAPSDTPPDLDALESDFAALMDELVETRSRIAAVGNQLFRTKLRVRVSNRADDQLLGRLVIRVDGAPVFESQEDVGDEGRQAFEGFAAPGPHEITLEAEQRARASDDYRYTLRDTFRFEVRENQLTDVWLVLDDRSDIAEDFEDDGEGEYAVRTRMRVTTEELPADG
ncbi:MAG: hypothetical protein AAF447_17490 [Myxococcota bacterium]